MSQKLRSSSRQFCLTGVEAGQPHLRPRIGGGRLLSGGVEQEDGHHYVSTQLLNSMLIAGYYPYSCGWTVGMGSPPLHPIRP